MSTIDEGEMVVLECPLRDHGLERGDVGAVVHVYACGEGFEIEFVRGDGRTVAVVTVRASEVRPIAEGEILHVRHHAA